MLICHPSHPSPFHDRTYNHTARKPLACVQETEIRACRESANFPAISSTFSCLEVILAGSQPIILKQMTSGDRKSMLFYSVHGKIAVKHNSGTNSLTASMFCSNLCQA